MEAAVGIRFCDLRSEQVEWRDYAAGTRPRQGPTLRSTVEGRSAPCVSIRSVLRLSEEVKFVRGVGPHVSEMLKAKGIETAEDLLYHLPFRYEDRQNPRSLDELKPGDTASVIAEVRGAMLMRTRKMPIFELTV